MQLKNLTLRGVAALTIIALLFVALPVSPALADSAGANDAGAGADVAGVGTVTWGTPGNITTVGTPYATMFVGASAITHYLRATQYGFAIPTGSTINGITVVINQQPQNSTLPLAKPLKTRLFLNRL
jgi:hypothetical protein